MKRKITWGSMILLLSLSVFFAISAGAEKKEKVKVKLPKQPEIWEIYKSLDKKEHKKDLLSIQKAQEKLNPSDEKAYRIFPGFSGPYALELIDGDKIKVIDDSIHVLEQETWATMGLVRNETTKVVGEITIVAKLRDKEGKLLEKVEGTTLVNNVRPGEPAPFRLESMVLSDEVASIDWFTTYNGKPFHSSRELNITPSWELPFGVEQIGQYKRMDAPYPYAMHISFDNLGREIKDANLVVAWIDLTGKVQWIEEKSLDKENYANGVPVDGSADFTQIRVENPEIGPLLSEFVYMTWAEGK